MARKKRIWYEGACYHVMGRGVRRGVIFKKEEDYSLFRVILKKVQAKYPFILHAYCLMSNHFHMELTTIKDPIWRIMQGIMSSYARTFNQRNHFDGHLFDSRYTSCLIEDEKYFLEVSRYIHLNPVKAAMVREPLTYKYSSYGSYMAEEPEEQEDFLDLTRVLGNFRNNPREQYRMFVEGKISHVDQEMLIQKDMNEDEMWLPWE